jgi:hypothetical protein
MWTNRRLRQRHRQHHRADIHKQIVDLAGQIEAAQLPDGSSGGDRVFVTVALAGDEIVNLAVRDRQWQGQGENGPRDGKGNQHGTAIDVEGPFDGFLQKAFQPGADSFERFFTG